MKQLTKTNKIFSGTFGNVRIVKDFLPKPEELVMKEEQVKVTLSLSKKSVEFFKEVAKKQNVAYQSMIRRLLDVYTSKHI